MTKTVLKTAVPKGLEGSTPSLSVLSLFSNMLIKQRLLIGAMGALAPIFANLLVVDADHILKYAELYSTLGYLIRILLLALVGMFVAYLHDDETNRIKLFQLGMGGPALLIAALNGNHVHNHQDDATPVTEVQATSLGSSSAGGASVVKQYATFTMEPDPATDGTDPVASITVSVSPKVEVLKDQINRAKSKMQNFVHGLILKEN